MTTPAGVHITREETTLADGTRAVATLYSTGRPSGRRIILTTPDGAVLHDTDDCYDFANAVDSLSAFLTKR